MKGREILDFSKGGNLRKRGIDLGKEGGMTPLTNYDSDGNTKKLKQKLQFLFLR